jgi:hypothetical protein
MHSELKEEHSDGRITLIVVRFFGFGGRQVGQYRHRGSVVVDDRTRICEESKEAGRMRFPA